VTKASEEEGERQDQANSGARQYEVNSGEQEHIEHEVNPAKAHVNSLDLLNQGFN